MTSYASSITKFFVLFYLVWCANALLPFMVIGDRWVYIWFVLHLPFSAFFEPYFKMAGMILFFVTLIQAAVLSTVGTAFFALSLRRKK